MNVMIIICSSDFSVATRFCFFESKQSIELSLDSFIDTHYTYKIYLRFSVPNHNPYILLVRCYGYYLFEVNIFSL